MRKRRIDLTVHEEAYVMRPVRVVGEHLRVYAGTYFPKEDNPPGVINMHLRRMLGGVTQHGAEDEYATLDILDKDGDIIQDFAITKGGFEYLRRVLKFTWENQADIKPASKETNV